MNLIQTYWRKLDDLRRIAGADNEGALRPAFGGLLETLGQEHQLILFNEYSFKAKNGASLRADGVLVDRLRLVHGWWEAKDGKDKLEREIADKLAKGYPSDNIIFEDTYTAVLLQNNQEVLRCSVLDGSALEKLLNQFFNYQLPEVAHFRSARDKFLLELPGVAAALTDLLQAAHRDNVVFHTKAVAFLELCQRAIGERVTAHHVDEMLIQHILTDQIFRAVFPMSNFHQENHLAREIGQLEQHFLRGETRMSLLQRLEPYFAAIRRAAANTVTSSEKQDFLKAVYEDFYSAYNPKDADKLGVVYTPKEAVRFIVAGCDELAQQHFNKRLSDSGLDILDPCMGTGTFIVDVIDYLRGDKRALEAKYQTELHANEIAILPYYIACLNIEQSYYEATGQWRDFAGACFVNTLDNWGFQQIHEGAVNDLLGSLTDENHARIVTQNSRRIPVILGNPPYNANQQNENDNNKNDPAPQADKRIKQTYLAESTAQKTKLYDPYVRFLRWASDRIGAQGIVAFITNRSYLDSRQADGLRKTIALEFQEVWIVDLMSDVRKNPKISGTKHNIFGIQTGVAIAFLVRNPNRTGCDVHYVNLDDFMTAIEKRRWLAQHDLRGLARADEFTRIKPNVRGDWLNQPIHDWSDWLPVASKAVKSGKSQEAIFRLYSLGVSTNRDEWLYGLTTEEIEKKVNYFLNYYEVLRTNPRANDGGVKLSETLKRRLGSNKTESYTARYLQDAIYRPFVKKKIYLSSLLIDRVGSVDEIFGTDGSLENIVLDMSGTSSSKLFQVLVTSSVVCLDSLEKTQCLPLWIYDEQGTRQDNLTDWALNQFQTHYHDHSIQKRDIFNYVYAVLHDPRYRERFALNLKAEFPRIPFHPDFRAWAQCGAALIQLHAYFEQVAPYGLTRIDLEPKNGVIKCRLKADKMQGIIEIDTATRLEGIPAMAWHYQLGNRSALEWVLDQYRESTPKDPTIREKFNTYRFADHKEAVILLLDKVCCISVETMELVKQIGELAWAHSTE